MTTQNLEGIESLRAAINETAQNVRNRSRAVAEVADETERRMAQDDANAEIARRLLRRNNQDRLDEINEEAGQLAEILVGSPTPDSDDNNPPATADGTLPPPPPTTETTTVVTETEQNTRSRLDPRGWSKFEWVGAIIVAVIGFLLAWKVIDWLWGKPFSDSGWSNFFWIVGLAFGFAVGGAIGSLLGPSIQQGYESRTTRREEVRTETNS